MNNYEKYFGDVDKASETIEKILFGQIQICRDFCNFNEDECLNMDDFDCIDKIKEFLNKESNSK